MCIRDREYREGEIDKATVIDGPQLQLKLKDVDTTKGEPDDFDITLDFNNAELNNALNKGTLTVTGQTKVTGKDLSLIHIYLRGENRAAFR